MNTTIITEEVTIEHLKSDAEQTLYRSSLLVDYSLKHIKNNRSNEYLITAEVRGLQGGSIWLNVVSVERKNNNEETLIDSAVEELFESNLN